MKVAILGAGAGGLSAAAELGARGLEVRLWSRSDVTLKPLRDSGVICYEGVLGSGKARPALISTDLRAVLSGVDAILVCLPTFAHSYVATMVAHVGVAVPVVLNPGHTGGALEFSEVFRRHRMSAPPIAEFSTLTYVARTTAPDMVCTTGAARRVWVAALPGGEEAVAAAREMYASATPARDILATGLANVNLVLHPPGAILGASWIEATRGDFTFYVQGLTDGVGRVMEALDRERRAVAAEFGHELPNLFEEMRGIGTIEAAAEMAEGLAVAVRGGAANQKIKAPDSLSHRYYREDFWFGLRPFLALAQIAAIETPVANSLMCLGEALAGRGMDTEGRSAKVMGISGMTKRELLRKVRSDD